MRLRELQLRFRIYCIFTTILKHEKECNFSKNCLWHGFSRQCWLVVLLLCLSSVAQTGTAGWTAVNIFTGIHGPQWMKYSDASFSPGCSSRATIDLIYYWADCHESCYRHSLLPDDASQTL